MINRQELQYALDSICLEIFDEIISPHCNIPKGSITADTYLTEINEFLEEPNDEKKILRQIATKYQLSVNSIEYLENLPLAEIAVYIVINGKYNEDYRGLK
jgi:hypothetical protein